MNTQDFLQKPVRSLFFHYLMPSIFGTMVTSIYVLADTIIIGKGIGTVAMAALNIALPVYNIFFGLGLLSGVGGSVLMSIFRGKGEKAKADAVFTASFLLTLGFLALSMLVCTLYTEEIAWLLGGTEETMPYIMDYLPYIVWGMGAFFFSSYLQTFIRNDGAPGLAMTGVIAGGIVNIILDYVFVFPMHMGMKGAALATVIGSVLTVLILAIHFFTARNQLRFTFSGIRLTDFRDITINGFSSFFIEAASGLTIFVFNLQLLKYTGNTGVSVFGVISNTAIVVTCLCKGINQAAQPILSINFGAGAFDRIQNVRTLAIRTTIVVCAVPVLLGLAVPDLFTYIFLNPDEEILALSASAVRIYFTGFLMMGINMVFICCFQALFQNGRAFLLCILRGCILVILFACLFPLFLNVTGIWLAFPAAELVTMLIGIRLTGKRLQQSRN